MKPHKHRDLINAWADGAIIEYLDSPKGEKPERWNEVLHNQPLWHNWVEYRVQPTNVVVKGVVELQPKKCVFRPAEHWERENVKFEFDSDTGKLIGVSMIGHEQE